MVHQDDDSDSEPDWDSDASGSEEADEETSEEDEESEENEEDEGEEEGESSDDEEESGEGWDSGEENTEENEEDDSDDDDEEEEDSYDESYEEFEDEPAAEKKALVANKIEGADSDGDEEESLPKDEDSSTDGNGKMSEKNRETLRIVAITCCFILALVILLILVLVILRVVVDNVVSGDDDSGDASPIPAPVAPPPLTFRPTLQPTPLPSTAPVASIPAPTVRDTPVPSAVPTLSPTARPPVTPPPLTFRPTPLATPQPTAAATPEPTGVPSAAPSDAPSAAPSLSLPEFITIEAIGDTSIILDDTDETQRGSEDSLLVEQVAGIGFDFVALLDFNISGLPDGAQDFEREKTVKVMLEHVPSVVERDPVEITFKRLEQTNFSIEKLTGANASFVIDAVASDLTASLLVPAGAESLEVDVTELFYMDGHENATQFLLLMVNENESQSGTSDEFRSRGYQGGTAAPVLDFFFAPPETISPAPSTSAGPSTRPTTSTAPSTSNMPTVSLAPTAMPSMIPPFNSRSNSTAIMTDDIFLNDTDATERKFVGDDEPVDGENSTVVETRYLRSR